jgi:hypothetical protein
VTATEARCLAYMMDIESHTVVYLRDLLATRAVLEPDVTAFLSSVPRRSHERRHFAFYRAQARQRLAASRNARRMTRWAMEHLWARSGRGCARSSRPTS